ALCFPWSSRAASVAILPSTISSASMTCHCRCTLPAVGTNEPILRSLSAAFAGAPADEPKQCGGCQPRSKDGKPKGYRRLGALSRQSGHLSCQARVCRSCLTVLLAAYKNRHRKNRLGRLPISELPSSA